MKLSHLARLAALSMLIVASSWLSACHQSESTPWQLTDISGHMPDLSFRLTDDQGKTVTAADYRGKVALLYFGYTHCPDVCPLTLAQLHVVLQKLGPLADGVRILFVSVDPTRDTPAVLHDYVAAFDPRAVGLTGSPSDIEALTKRYRAAFTREPGKADGSYDVSHSSGIYVFDNTGKARLLATPTDPQDKLVHDLHLLLSPGHAP
ncbi:SCO family protein [Dyella mobilis]|uniref:SCO family protein n=1 Tax=Dyella mobilis TaxID=1849582 RepID=A0ABS2KHE6_9GAMM|nr:SCO family protein [Dyella mobilis]MBM7130571.1 SCO family protein [Dyella mobilis]GLQ97198.1 photosynthetic protein synthase I [Dyella mobilis]